MDAERLGIFIQTCRKELGMTQGELGAKLNVTDKAISRRERGVGFPDIKLLEPLAEALHISIEELMHCQRLQTKYANIPQKKPWYYLHRKSLAALCIVVYGLFCLLKNSPRFVDQLLWTSPLSCVLFMLTVIAVLYASYQEVFYGTD